MKTPSTINQTDKAAPESGFGADALTEGFLRRSMRMTAALIGLGSIYCLVYVGQWQALAFLSAGVWGLVNILFLKAIVEAALKTGKIDKITVYGLLLVKFPVLYYSGYGLLSFEYFDVKYLMAGFSLFFAVVVLKAMGRALMKIDSHPTGVERESFLN